MGVLDGILDVAKGVVGGAVQGVTGVDLLGVAADAGGMAYNAAESRAARKWSEKMSSTAHQREVKDLKAAGLNPILSAGGHGASTPGSTLSSSMPQLGQSLRSGMATAASVQAMKANAQRSTAEASYSTNQAKAQSEMYDWLDDNPGFRDLFFASKLAKEAGLPPSVFGPGMGASSAGTYDKIKAYGKKLGQWISDNSIQREVYERDRQKDREWYEAWREKQPWYEDWKKSEEKERRERDSMILNHSTWRR